LKEETLVLLSIIIIRISSDLLLKIKINCDKESKFFVQEKKSQLTNRGKTYLLLYIL